MAERRPRLVLADDHHLLVEGLRNMLSERFDVVGVAHDGDQLLRLLRRRAPDLLLLDLSLPGKNGLELLPEITARRPRLRVLVVTMHLDRVLAEASLMAGAHGFIPKDSSPGELFIAIAEVLGGRRYLSPRIPAFSRRTGLRARHVGLSQLTERQQDIVHMIGRGMSTARIADELGLSESTVSFHRGKIRKILGIDSDWGLVRYAIMVQMSDEPASD